jgi:hypothetical protein
MHIYRNLKLHIIRLLSFAKTCHVLWQKQINIKEEPAAFNFRVRFYQDGGSMLFWNSKFVPKKARPRIPKASNLQSLLQEPEILHGWSKNCKLTINLQLQLLRHYCMNFQVRCYVKQLLEVFLTLKWDGSDTVMPMLTSLISLQMMFMALPFQKHGFFFQVSCGRKILFAWNKTASLYMHIYITADLDYHSVSVSDGTIVARK